MTISQAYLQAVTLLQAGGETDTGEARAKARLLLDAVCLTRHAHLLRADEPMPSGATTELNNLLAKVSKGYPVPYALGRCEFLGLSFRCDERALIPRPETETLVEAAIEYLSGQANPLIADLGTGAGCIAIGMAHALRGAIVQATDASPGALELAHANAQSLGVAARVHFSLAEAGVWAPPPPLNGKAVYDAILSNPPYIAASEIPLLQPEIRDWEPRLALDGGMDGLDCYRQIAVQCAGSLSAEGFLLLELGIAQFESVAALFRGQGWQVAPPINDLAGIARVLEARL